MGFLPLAGFGLGGVLTRRRSASSNGIVLSVSRFIGGLAMAKIPEHELKLCDMYVDETCVTQHRYMVLGCTVTETCEVPMIATELRETKESVGLPHEIKWERVAKRNYHRYIKIVDCFFDHLERDLAHFHALVIDTSKLDHHAFNQGDRETGFSKFVYQLVLKGSRLYGPPVKFRVALDERHTAYSLAPVRDMLNFKARTAYGMDHFPYRRLQHHDSKKSLMLQMTDILTGAIGFRANGKDAVMPRMTHRIALSEHIRQRAGLSSLSAQTMPNGRFTVWHMKLSAARGPRSLPITA